MLLLLLQSAFWHWVQVPFFGTLLSRKGGRVDPASHRRAAPPPRRRPPAAAAARSWVRSRASRRPCPILVASSPTRPWPSRSARPCSGTPRRAPLASAGTGADAGQTLMTRHVAPRNVPTVINAVFNDRNFWDGRANNIFNGNNPFGSRDTSASVLVADAAGNLSSQKMALKNASLA